ncbi:ImmA/IrrE family metallo-endopeptidase [Oerskovia sp. NPDC056781]|uniref:ImmA/IrrE family metallo-endopeptidase n=1 Tax=Oerskovia sp. NPDC056781 TaxID=3345942 RepID=UPI00366BCE2E
MYDLIEHAESLGLEVLFDDLGARHAHIREDGVVVINESRSHLLQRVALAHECGHHVHRHVHMVGARESRQEWQADEYAANLLFGPREYAQAERMYGPDVTLIARELGVPARMIHAWRRAWRANAHRVPRGFAAFG